MIQVEIIYNIGLSAAAAKILQMESYADKCLTMVANLTMPARPMIGDEIQFLQSPEDTNNSKLPILKIIEIRYHADSNDGSYQCKAVPKYPATEDNNLDSSEIEQFISQALQTNQYSTLSVDKIIAIYPSLEPLLKNISTS